MSPRRLVIADDEPDVLASLCELFGISGHWQVVAAVSSGDELRAAIDEHRPHLVMTDLHMPSGEVELIQQIGARSDRPLLVVLSASVGTSLARKLRAAGADLVLRKGIDAPLAAVERLWAERMTS